MVIKYLISLVVLLSLIVAISLLRYKKDLTMYRDILGRATRGSRTLETVDYSIQYELYGKGIPVLVSHGITGGVDQGKGMVETYMSSNYQYIFISRFGYLNSTMPGNPSVEKQADAYKLLLDSLNIDKVWIYANSAGGTSAIQFAMNYPDRTLGLILQSSNMPGEYPSLPPKPVMEVVFGNNYVYYSSMSLFGNQMLKTFMTDDLYRDLDSNKKRDLRSNVLLSSLPIATRKQGIIFDMFTSNVNINQLKTNRDVLKMPVLIVHAHDDPSIPIEYARSFAENLSNCELVEVNGGHLMIGNETQVKNVISTFITKNTE